jgi:ribosomal protein L29
MKIVKKTTKKKQVKEKFDNIKEEYVQHRIENATRQSSKPYKRMEIGEPKSLTFLDKN